MFLAGIQLQTVSYVRARQPRQNGHTRPFFLIVPWLFLAKRFVRSAACFFGLALMRAFPLPEDDVSVEHISAEPVAVRQERTGLGSLHTALFRSRQYTTFGENLTILP